MKIWVTRPSTWDLLVRGIGRCELWLHKPFYDTTPRGLERDPLYPQLPRGWQVLDPIYGDVTGQVCLPVSEALPDGQYEDFANALWDALCRSVDGMGPEEQGGALRRFDKLIDAGLEEREAGVMSTFLFEYDAPPTLWFSAARLNGIEYQTAAGQWAQRIFAVDTDFGIEAPEPPPPAHAVIDFSQMALTVGD